MPETHSLAPSLTVKGVQLVSPALAHYTLEVLMNGVWQRPQLSPRDRGLITVTALIAHSQTLAMPHYFEKALDSGVKASELSEIILHLAFYCGLPNAMAAVNPAEEVFHKHGISARDLPPVEDELLPLNEEAEHFYKPAFAGGPPDMFLCGENKSAKEQISDICEDFGWNPIDVGGIEVSHYLEAMAMIWIVTAFRGGHWNQEFKLLRK